MPEPTAIERAELHELDADFSKTVNDDRTVKVQFNPETLKVTFANQIVQNNGAGDQRGSQTRQFVGAGTTKLALQLWFDVTAYPDGTAPADDVRKLTARVAYFITPRSSTAAPAGQAAPGRVRWIGRRLAAPKFAPPAVRFIWGSFQFDGMVEPLEESLEFWSPDGRPLRASVSLACRSSRSPSPSPTAAAERRRRVRPALGRHARRSPRPRPERPCPGWPPRPARARRGSRSPAPTGSRTRCACSPASSSTSPPGSGGGRS